MRLLSVLCISTVVLSGCGSSGDGSSSNNHAPVASNVAIEDINGGDIRTQDILKATYQYTDQDGDQEGNTKFRWTIDGKVVSEESEYAPVYADIGKTITLEVTPVASDGKTTGNAVSVETDSAVLERELLIFTAMAEPEDEFDIAATAVPSPGENFLGLYATDGSESGTTLLRKVVIATKPEKLDNNFIIPIGYWNDENTPRGALLLSDGTAEGTKTIKESSIDELPWGLATFNGKVFLSWENADTGRELWVTDGTEENTKLFKDLIPGEESSSPAEFTVVGDQMYFRAYASDGSRKYVLWQTNGTEEGTEEVSPAVYNPRNLTEYKGNLVLAGSINQDLPADIEPLYLDTDTGETTLIADINPGLNTSNPSFYTHGDRLLIRANSPTYGNQRLWFSQGETGDPELIEATAAAFPYVYATSQGLFGINSSNPDEPYASLWSLNETEGATKMTMENNLEYKPLYIADLNGTAYVSAQDAMEDRELYRVEEGTLKLVADINENGSSYPGYLTTVNNTLVFIAQNDEFGRELWRTDGTETGTQLLMDITAGTQSSDIILDLSKNPRF